jgi:hypothetical protein
MNEEMQNETQNLTLNVKYTTFKTLTLKYTATGYTPTKILVYFTNTLYLPHRSGMGIYKDYIPMMGMSQQQVC